MSNSMLILLLSLFLSLKCAHSGPRSTEAARICANATAPPPQRQAFLLNFLAALEAVTPLVSRQRYAAVVRGGTNGSAAVYAFGECMKDLSQRDCDVCFALSKIRILSCLAIQFAILGGRIFYDGCYIRYEDFDFFNQSLSLEDRTVCGGTDFGGDLNAFEENALKLVRNLSAVAMKNDGFAVGFSGLGTETVYGLAQCWEFVNGSACEECLGNAVVRIGSCPPKEEGRVLNAGCYLRYSTQKFYDNSTRIDDDVGNGGSRRVAKILAVTFAALAVVLTMSAVAFLTRKKLLKKRKEEKQFGPLLATANMSQLNFSYEVLEEATNYFHDSNKLGQGGSGSVYKGTLPDGKVVAIKRLFFNTRQWVDHFFNEVNLISGIHHKNLVKLLGCSLTGPESLLVYEYVPNKSLYDYFVVKNNVEPPLRWELRYKVILGTAEGLAYLHEESQGRIIHRDIKLSNILLDEEFMPKIADFGLARLLPEDKTHISTAIAGTLGYMAPEYIVRGTLTEKADVYSFGVLVIEVVCGKRNNFFISNSASILQMTWDLYRAGRVCNAVDPLLEGMFEEEEASRLLQIGLLCVQASAKPRPTMSFVVKLLTEHLEIPQPTQPPFLNSGSSEFSGHLHSGASATPPEFNNPQFSRNSMSQSWIEPR